MTNLSDLIHIAAELSRGVWLPNIDTEHWYASTPLAERLLIIKAMRDAHERHKDLAVRLREIYDAQRKDEVPF